MLTQSKNDTPSCERAEENDKKKLIAKRQRQHLSFLIITVMRPEIQLCIHNETKHEHLCLYFRIYFFHKYLKKYSTLWTRIA